MLDDHLSYTTSQENGKTIEEYKMADVFTCESPRKSPGMSASSLSREMDLGVKYRKIKPAVGFNY